MAMPTNSKTWTYDTNNEVNLGTTELDLQEITFQFVRSLVAGGAAVVSCSYWDGSIFQVANADNWTAASNLKWGAFDGSGTRGWAVVRMPAAFGSTLDILVILQKYSVTTTNTTIGLYVTPKGYNLATGTTSAPPTVNSGTAIALMNPTNVSDGSENFIPGTVTKKIWNSAYSSDGTCFRFFTFSESLCCQYFEISKLKSPAAELSANNDDWLVLSHPSRANTATSKVTYANFYTNSTTYNKSYIDASGGITIELSGECRLGGTTPATNQYTTVPNPQDNDAYPLLPIGAWSNTNTAYAYGRHGEVYDIWWVSSPLANGSTFPGDGSKTHIKLGEAIVVPWEAGVVPVIA